MTRRLAGLAAAAALAGSVALSTGGTQAVAGNTWDRVGDPDTSQGPTGAADNSSAGHTWD